MVAPNFNRRKIVTASDRYRDRALKLCQRANAVRDRNVRVEYESLAFAYMSLAEQAERELAGWVENSGLR